jgi:hypothetical protein
VSELLVLIVQKWKDEARVEFQTSLRVRDEAKQGEMASAKSAFIYICVLEEKDNASLNPGILESKEFSTFRCSRTTMKSFIAKPLLSRVQTP